MGLPPSQPSECEKGGQETIEERGDMYLSSSEAASLPWEQVSRNLLTDVNCGISSAEAITRRKIVGTNEFSEPEDDPFWKKYLGQVRFLFYFIFLRGRGGNFMLPFGLVFLYVFIIGSLSLVSV